MYVQLNKVCYKATYSNTDYVKFKTVTQCSTSLCGSKCEGLIMGVRGMQS